MNTITILSPGLMSTVQDGGRMGFQRYGMAISGAMDWFAYRMANFLVGNHPGEACIETTLSGPEIQFGETGLISITGAEMEPEINGKRVRNWQTIRVEKQDLLQFGALQSGCRGYIAFSGGIDVPVIMESRSTYLRTKTGGYNGRMLQKGDVLPLGKEKPNQVNDNAGRTLPEYVIPEYFVNPEVRIIPGPEVNRISFEGIRQFLVSEFKVTPQCDRMGYRLDGPPIGLKTDSSDIISAGIVPGTIQVTGNGQLIILMSDCQTTGGYTRIASIVSADMPLVAQLKPGDTIRFREITVEEAQNAYYQMWNKIQKYFNFMDNL